MHRDVVSHVCITRTDFLLTASQDGHLKFWKKKDPSDSDASGSTAGVGIEFVKHYRAHLSPVLALVASSDGALAATVAADISAQQDQLGSIKVFDVENFGECPIFHLLYFTKADSDSYARRHDQHPLTAISPKHGSMGTRSRASTLVTRSRRARLAYHPDIRRERDERTYHDGRECAQEGHESGDLGGEFHSISSRRSVRMLKIWMRGYLVQRAIRYNSQLGR